MTKTILITGASSGLGAALAHAYAARGDVRLCLNGRDAARLNNVAEACRALGAEVHHFACDVTDRDVMHHWVQDSDKRFGVDIVIANAGISGGTLNLTSDDYSGADYKIFDVNVTGVINTILPILPSFIRRKNGQIVIMSSLASFAPWGGAPAYAASKAAVRVYGEALASSLKPHNISVTTICPGFIKTPLTDVNPFPMPFLMSADKAATNIIRAIDRRMVRYAFPWPTAIIAQLMGLIPPPLIQVIMRNTPKKP